MLRTIVLVGIAAMVLGAATAGPAPAAAGCHGRAATQLFLDHGIHTVRVNAVGCRRAVRTLRRWANGGMRGAGPAAWRCRARRLNREVKRVRCSRRDRRLRFDVGGG